MTQSIRIERCADKAPLLDTIMSVCADEIERRCGVPVRTAGAGDLTIRMGLANDLASEGFRIRQPARNTVQIAGGMERGLLYGLGQFLRSSRCLPGQLVPGPITGVDCPEKPVRIMYFATHFHNFYHVAPMQEIRAYIRDLALWGYNTIAVWFDMHHYSGIRDPEAQRMIRRLHGILKAANECGMGGALTFLANEAFAASPKSLRADWTAGHDGYCHAPYGHYNIELCPSKPAGRALILKWREEVLKAFSDVKLDYVVLWPYDQGGCTCSKCAPWGANGYLKIAPSLAAIARRYFPRSKVILSTWYFDKFVKGEWEGMAKAFKTKPLWANYLMADDYGEKFPEYPLAHGTPGNLPLLSFPEISMWGMSPWGGFGANPQPERLQRIWAESGRRLQGGMPYSEGIYEDINKFIFSRFYWNGKTKAIDAVREYAAYYFSPHAAAAITRAIDILEKNQRNHWTLCHCGRSFCLGNSPDKRDYGSAVAWRLLKQAAASLPADVRKSWRWRILRNRALLDYELTRTGGRITRDVDAALDDLTEIYHAAACSEPPDCYVVPPNRRIRRVREMRNTRKV